jgi:hypothetical protein
MVDVEFRMGRYLAQAMLDEDPVGRALYVAFA